MVFPVQVSLDIFVSKAAPHIHAEQKIPAAREVLSLAGVKQVCDTEPVAVNVLGSLLSKCLANRRLDLAAKLLWPSTLFTPEPRSVNMIWQAVQKHNFTLLMGASSMGKSYTPAVLFFLEWLADPTYTNVKCIGPSENHLQDNLFTHLVKLHNEAALPIPGQVGALFIGLSTRDRRSSIQGVVLPIGRKSAGRLQGAKRHPRPTPHPVYGKMSRLFLLIDELENVPTGLYPDLENQMSNISGEDDNGFKVVGAFNPKDVTLEPGRMSEPEGGWKSFDIDKDEEWTSKKGWRVIRLDAEKSENVVQKRLIYPGLQSHAALENLSRKAGGRTAPGYYTFGRGAYPPQGADLNVIPATLLDSCVAELVFRDRPTDVAGVDLALDGGDHAKFCHGQYGVAVGFKVAGKLVRFKQPKNCLQISAIYTLPKGDTVQMAKSTSDLAKALSVRPEMLCLDRTGHTRGVSDILVNTWGQILSVNYSESSTDRAIEEDGEKCSEEFDRVTSELYFATRFWFERQHCFFAPDFDRTEVVSQLSGRRYDPTKKNKVESKKDYKLRNRGLSPDDADAVTLTVHLIRHRLMAVLPPAGKIGTPADKPVEADDEPAYVDPTNIADTLD